MGGKSEAPPPPDYAAAAQATASGNLEAAQYATKANRIDQVNPYGSLTYSRDGAKILDNTAYQTALGQYNTNVASAGQPGQPAQPSQAMQPGAGLGVEGASSDPYYSPGGATAAAPQPAVGGSGATFTRPDQKDYMIDDPNAGWKQTVELSDTGKQLFDQQNKTSLGLAGLQDAAMASVAAAQGKGWSGGAIPEAGKAYAAPTTNATALDPSSYTGATALDSSGYTNATALDASKYAAPTAFNASNFKGPAATSDGGAFSFGSGSSDRVNVADRSKYYDASRVGAVGNVYDSATATNTATQDILSRVAPELQRQRSSLENQLANQGITRGSEAWNSAIDGAGRQENDAYIQARMQGIGLGMQQQGQTYGQTMGNRNALTRDQEILFGQQSTVRNQDLQQAHMNQQASIADANRALAAQQASAGMTLQSQQQAFGQANSNARLSLDAQNQGFSQQQLNNTQQAALQNQGFTQQQLANSQSAALQGQTFEQQQLANSQSAALQGQQFNQQGYLSNQAAAQQQQQFNQTNQTRATALAEQAAEEIKPLNYLSALRTGSQVQNPTFGSYAQQQTTAGADMLTAANMGYQANLGATNAANAASANGMSGLANIAGAAMSFSDERLKKDIRRVGELPNGVGIYVFTFIGEATAQLGLIAQDVLKIMPDAVTLMPNGFYAVNYAEVLK